MEKIEIQFRQQTISVFSWKLFQVRFWFHLLFFFCCLRCMEKQRPYISANENEVIAEPVQSDTWDSENTSASRPNWLAGLVVWWYKLRLGWGHEQHNTNLGQTWIQCEPQLVATAGSLEVVWHAQPSACRIQCKQQCSEFSKVSPTLCGVRCLSGSPQVCVLWHHRTG